MKYYLLGYSNHKSNVSQVGTVADYGLKTYQVAPLIMRTTNFEQPQNQPFAILCVMHWALFINFKILKTMIYITILNTLAIVYLIVSKKSKYYLQFRKETTTWEKILLGYRISLWKKTSEHFSSSKYSIYLKVRDRKKTEMEEDARKMIAEYSQQNKLQSLTAKFSWLKTWVEVREFQKYYTCVDQKIVENLVAKFVPKVS